MAAIDAQSVLSGKAEPAFNSDRTLLATLGYNHLLMGIVAPSGIA